MSPLRVWSLKGGASEQSRAGPCDFGRSVASARRRPIHRHGTGPPVQPGRPDYASRRRGQQGGRRQLHPGDVEQGRRTGGFQVADSRNCSHLFRAVNGEPAQHIQSLDRLRGHSKGRNRMSCRLRPETPGFPDYRSAQTWRIRRYSGTQ